MSKKKDRKKKRKQKHFWEAVLKDNHPIIVRFMVRDKGEEQVLKELYIKQIEELERDNTTREWNMQLGALAKIKGGRTKEQVFFDDAEEWGTTRMMVAIVDEKIVAFLQLEEPMPEFDLQGYDEDVREIIRGKWIIINSYTLPEYRKFRINKFMKLILLRKRTERSFYVPINSEKRNELVESYKKLAKKTDMNIKIIIPEKNPMSAQIFITKKRDTNDLLENMLKEDFLVEYYA